MERVEKISQLLPLSGDEVHVWGLHIPSLGQLERLQALLNKSELHKAERFQRRKDQESSIAARGALRVLLGAYSGQEPQQIHFSYTENGKPYLEGSSLGFNVSHSEDWVVLAFGCDRNIGVDIEQIRRNKVILPIATRYFTHEEVAWIEQFEDMHAVFFQLWARKEAYVKACGSALFRELSSFSVPLKSVGEKDGWFFYDLKAGSKYAAAVVSDKPMADVPCYDFGGLKWDS
ncbi:MAG TPA: 4'-phosphopantetheinyl transferase superfamily protein [Pontiella sp.]